MTALPLGIVSLFVLVEALGLEPALLQRAVHLPLTGTPVLVKYLIVVFALMGVATAYMAQRRNDRQARSIPGFSPRPAIGRTAA